MMFPMLDVIERLIHLVRVHSLVMRYCEKQNDDVDTEEFDQRLLRLIAALNDRTKSHIRHRACPGPGSWTIKEATQWEKYAEILTSNTKGKIVLKEWLCEGCKDMLDPAKIMIEDDEGEDFDVGDANELGAVVEAMETSD